MSEAFEQLLRVQERDLAIEQLRHRRATLPERAVLTECVDEARLLIGRQKALREAYDTVMREERRLEAEAAALRAKAEEVSATLYSGTVTSPRELQALQADIDQLKQHAGSVEDVQIERMAEREVTEGELFPIEQRLTLLRAEVATLQSAIQTAETEIDAELVVVEEARETEAQAVAAPLLRDYDSRRRSNSGQGVARLIGDTCQACRLSIPATEVDQLRHDETDRVWYCDNCGAILVAS